MATRKYKRTKKRQITTVYSPTVYPNGLSCFLEASRTWQMENSVLRQSVRTLHTVTTLCTSLTSTDNEMEHAHHTLMADRRRRSNWRPTYPWGVMQYQRYRIETVPGSNNILQPWMGDWVAFNSWCWTSISVCNQPPRPTQPSILPGRVNEDKLRLGRKRQVWFIPLADECGVCK